MNVEGEVTTRVVALHGEALESEWLHDSGVCRSRKCIMNSACGDSLPEMTRGASCHGCARSPWLVATTKEE